MLLSLADFSDYWLFQAYNEAGETAVPYQSESFQETPLGFF